MTHQIAVLALEDVAVFDLGVPAQIFHAADDDGGTSLYQVRTCTPDGGSVRTSAGFRAVPDDGPEILETADTIIIAGIHAGTALTDGTIDQPVTEALARRRPDSRLISICTGAFVLGAA